MSNFNFQWTKTLYQNILSHIVFFLTLFKGYRCNIVICNNTKDNFLCRASDRLWKKKSNFTGFLGKNSRKNHPISWEFHGKFQGKLLQKAVGKKRPILWLFSRQILLEIDWFCADQTSVFNVFLTEVIISPWKVWKRRQYDWN